MESTLDDSHDVRMPVRMTAGTLRPTLFLGQLAFELAVTVEHDLGAAGVDGADDIDGVALAELRHGLERPALPEGCLEVALLATLLLEPALHRRAVDGDVDGHLVAGTLAGATNVHTGAGPGVHRLLGGRGAREQRGENDARGNRHLGHGCRPLATCG